MQFRYLEKSTKFLFNSKNTRLFTPAPRYIHVYNHQSQCWPYRHHYLRTSYCGLYSRSRLDSFYARNYTIRNNRLSVVNTDRKSFHLNCRYLLKSHCHNEVPNQNLQKSGGNINCLLERFWQWRLNESPEYATKCGIHRNDDKLEDLTEESFLKQKQQAVIFLKEAEQLQSFTSDHGNIQLHILMHLLRAFISGYDFRRFSMFNPVNTADGVFTDWRHLMTWMNFDSEEDYDMMLLRLRAMVRQVYQKIDLMRLAIQYSTTLHRASMGRVLGSLSAEIERDAEKSFCYGPFLTMPSEIDSNKRLLLHNEYRRVMTEELIPALVILKQFISDEYLPSTRSDVAVSCLEDGDKFYNACLNWHLSMDLSPEEIHQIGRDEVDRLVTTMEKLKSKEEFRGSLKDFMTYIHSHRKNCNTSEESMLKGYRKIIGRVHGRQCNLFHEVPDINVIVKRSRGDAYTEPSLDGTRPGIFWADVSYPHTKSKSNMVALALHEAIPGHHTQACYTIGQKIPSFRRQIEDRKYFAIPFNWPIFTAYVEGWALYAESLGEELGMYTDNYSLFGRYMSELFRACRLVVDTGIHHYRWSKRRAIDYMKELSSDSTYHIEAEINRYISWPGQACAYKIGELEIKRLRELAEEELGDSFDVRDFHEEVLSMGPVPLDVLEKHIRNWITSDSDDAQDLASS